MKELFMGVYVFMIKISIYFLCLHSMKEFIKKNHYATLCYYSLTAKLCCGILVIAHYSHP